MTTSPTASEPEFPESAAAGASAELAQTPLDKWHRDHGAKMVPFAGFEMPIQYSAPVRSPASDTGGPAEVKGPVGAGAGGGIVAEHQACRTAAALFDVSHMGRLRFDGEGAAQLLDRLLTRRVTDLPVGGVRYSMVCNDRGGVLDDVLVSYLETPSQTKYHLLVVNASNRQKIIDWITPHLSDFPGVTMSDRTELTAMIAVQGPLVMETCKRLFSFDPGRLKNYQAKITEQFRKPVIVSRTGYTGEDGLELIVRAEEATRIWENLLLAGREAGFAPAGLGARDTLRMEAGMPLYGHELNETIDPLSAGLSFSCSLKDREFVGADAIRSIRQSGPPRRRIGLLPEGRRPAREGCAVITDDGREVGVVTSGGPSPTLGVPIAMAMVDAADAGHQHYQIDIRGRRSKAAATPLPFYRRNRPSSAQ